MAQVKIFVYLGVGISAFLTFAWFILLVCPMKWIHTKTAFMDIEVNLFSVYAEAGIAIDGACLLPAPGVCEFLRSLVESSKWISDAKEEFCQFRFACNDWHNLWVATWITAMFGFVGIIALGIGAASMAYYSLQHATETGRRTTMIALCVAPGAFLIGMLWMTLMSSGWGSDPTWALLNGIIGGQPHAAYGTGFVLAWFFTILSVLPLIIMVVFGKADQFEKRRGEDPNDLDGLYPGAYDQYATNPYGAYGGQQQQWPPPLQGGMQANGRQVELSQWPQSGGFQVQANTAYGMRPMSVAPQAAPGFGAAAW